MSYNEHIFQSKLSQNSHVVCSVFESKLLHLFCLFNCHVDKWIPSLLLAFFKFICFCLFMLSNVSQFFFVLNCHLSNSQHTGTKVLSIEVHLLHMIVMGLDGSRVSGLFRGGTGLHFLCKISRCCQIYIYIYTIYHKFNEFLKTNQLKLILKKKSLEIVTFLYMGSNVGYPKLCNDVFFFFFPFHILLIGKSN